MEGHGSCVDFHAKKLIMKFEEPNSSGTGLQTWKVFVQPMVLPEPSIAGFKRG